MQDVKHSILKITEGLRLVLLNNNGDKVPAFWQSWDDSIVVEEHRILGMGAVEMTVQSLDSLANTLENLFGYELASRTSKRSNLPVGKRTGFW